jgi:hypothetical protein
MFIYRINVKQLGVLEASTHTFFGMLGCAIICANRFARKFAFGERSGITLDHAC